MVQDRSCASDTDVRILQLPNKVWCIYSSLDFKLYEYDNLQTYLEKNTYIKYIIIYISYSLWTQHFHYNMDNDGTLSTELRSTFHNP